MIERCHDVDNSSYRFYGGRGIKVCNEWLNNRQAFNDWAVSHGYAENLTIDRIDSTKGYSPENCRWVTKRFNSKWKSTTSMIEVNGILDSYRGWSRRLHRGVNYISRFAREKGLNACIEHIKENMHP